MSDHEIVGPASSFYVSQRLKLHFADWGNEEAPPLLLVHGGKDHARSWDWTARALRRNYHVIAPDLRGHGDSDWAIGGQYTLHEFALDLAQLVDTLDLAPVRIVAHSLGAAVSLFYTGIFPDTVSKLVAVEGMGMPEQVMARVEGPAWDVMEEWIESVRACSRREPRRYATIDEAAARMQSENAFLSSEQARHLTVHGVARNEDGTFSWKFDNWSRPFFPLRMPRDSVESLWQRIECPTLLIHGTESWHGDPSKDGRAQFVRNAEVLEVHDAGHWVHHDQLDLFLEAITAFLAD
jgi:pimeloyl-ACP methyl ester carboxylesterase